MESWKKTFAVIWSGQLASILSSEVVAYSIIFWMSLETGSAQVLALAAGLELSIDDAEAVQKSWPHFFEAIKPLGAEVEYVG